MTTVAIRKSNMNHQPLHAKVNRLVRNPAITVKITFLIQFFVSIIMMNSHVIISGKKTTQASLSACPNNVLQRNAPLIANANPENEPPMFPLIFLAIKKTISTHNADTITG